MGAKLLIRDWREQVPTPIRLPAGSGPARKHMNRESQARFVAVLLFVATVAAVVLAGLNFQKERKSTAPDDGVVWVERGGHLVADQLVPDGSGAKSGIKAGDELVAVNGQEIKNTSGLERQMYRTGVYSKAT